MVLVSERGGGREEEGPGNHGDEEGETEEEEGGAGEGVAVPGSDGVLVGEGAELFGGEGWHFCLYVGFWGSSWSGWGLWLRGRMRRASAAA